MLNQLCTWTAKTRAMLRSLRLNKGHCPKTGILQIASNRSAPSSHFIALPSAVNMTRSEKG
jgi:hypothetical protein